MSDSVRPHRQQPTRLPRPWDSPGKNTGVGCHFLLQCTKVESESEVAQSCPTLSDPMDCSPSGFSVHGIFQARGLEWGAISFSDPLPTPPHILLNHRSQVHSPLFRAILDSNILCVCVHSLCVCVCVCVCVCKRERRKEKRQGDLSYYSGILESMSERDLRI